MRTLFSRADLDAARRWFVERKAAASEALDAATVDPEGRMTIRAYFDAFFHEIESDAAFYRPIVVRDQTEAYLDAARMRKACANRSTVPMGTVVGKVVERRDEMIRVPLLDSLWQWAMDAPCDMVRTSPVWIAANAVDTQYPR